MHDWLSQRARVTPEREALVVADTGNSWDYGTLDETVDEMAGRLSAHGVGAGDHVGCVLETGAPQVCLVHAAMRLGAVLVPFAPSFTAPELADRLARADVSVVLCGEETEQTVVEAGTEVTDGHLSMLTIGDPQWTEVTSLGDLESVAVTPYTWDRGDVQLLLFTSGTTGDPKVVQLTMGNLLSSAIGSGFRLGVDPADRWLVPLSLHHMGGIAPVLRSTLYGTTTIVRANFDPGRTVDDIQTYDATAISLVPTMLRRMLSARGTLPDCLRFVLVGGAPCPVELVERCRNFSVPICPTYGMTETASQVATARHREAYETPATVGRPLMWTDVTVVGDDGRPVPAGESGELVVAGPTVSPGYYGDDEATAGAKGEFGFHTGDVGRFDEKGRLFILNRLDDRIVTGGENVDPGEVVDALLSHPAVEEAAVVGLSDEEWGERVGALVVPEDEPPLVGELESYLRERLAGFKLPRTVGFAEALPRTVSGTVERGAVREQLLDGATGAIEYAESSDDEDEDGSDGETGDAEVRTGDADDDTRTVGVDGETRTDGVDVRASGDGDAGDSAPDGAQEPPTEDAAGQSPDDQSTNETAGDDGRSEAVDAVSTDADDEAAAVDADGEGTAVGGDAPGEGGSTSGGSSTGDQSMQEDGEMEFGDIGEEGDEEFEENGDEEFEENGDEEFEEDGRDTPSTDESNTQNGDNAGPESSDAMAEGDSQTREGFGSDGESGSDDEEARSGEPSRRTEESQPNEN